MGEKHPQQSSMSRAALLIMKSMRIKESSTLIPFIEKKQTGAKPKNRYRKSHSLSRYQIHGNTVWHLLPSGRNRPPRLKTLYLHGGSYELGFHPRHWTFIARLADTLNSEMFVPDYPLAPDHQALEVIDMVTAVYHSMLEAMDDQSVVIMGDSAGGGLALALAQQLLSTHDRQPDHLALFSPWLDVTMSNPLIPALERTDPLLNVQKLMRAGEAYAGGLDPADPRVSPIFGNFTGLCPMSVFVGTADLFLADCRKLKKQAQGAGVPIYLYEIPGMTHPGIFLPIPEARWILQRLKATFKDPTESTDRQYPEAAPSAASRQ